MVSAGSIATNAFCFKDLTQRFDCRATLRGRQPCAKHSFCVVGLDIRTVGAQNPWQQSQKIALNTTVSHETPCFLKLGFRCGFVLVFGLLRHRLDAMGSTAFCEIGVHFAWQTRTIQISLQALHFEKHLL